MITKAASAVAQQAEFGDWKVLRHDGESVRRVIALCRSCDIERSVDIFNIMRRGRTRCQSCANKSKYGSYQPLPPGEAVKRSLYRDMRRDAVRRKYEFDLSYEQTVKLVSSDCEYCGSEPNRLVKTRLESMLANGIDRVDNSIGYVVTNCVSCCKVCNYMKRTMTREEFIRHCKRVAARN